MAAWISIVIVRRERRGRDGAGEVIVDMRILGGSALVDSYYAYLKILAKRIPNCGYVVRIIQSIPPSCQSSGQNLV
jgi:hypothetical protein